MAPASAPSSVVRSHWIFVLALLAGTIFRFFGPLTSDFPLVDGGLFLEMARAVRANNFALPATVFYPTITPEIPFCYPPLPFYIAALSGVFGMPLETALRFWPACFASLSIWSFWRFARALLEPLGEGRLFADIATLFWALSPWTILWMNFGGGLTRAPGYFFALWCLEYAVRLWRDDDKKAFWAATILLALTVLCHLERARFLVVAVFLIWLVLNHTPRGFLKFGAWLSVGIVLCAPWWATCLARFGLEPFRASFASGSIEPSIATQLYTAFNSELFPPIVTMLALLGFLVYRREMPFVGLWFVAIMALELRSTRAFITVPIALGAALMIGKIRVSSLRLAAAGGLALWLGFQSTFTFAQSPPLPALQRTAMMWAKENTPPDSTFLVLPWGQNKGWFDDRTLEWFPALARRASPLTVQGSEWLAPEGTFARLVDRYIEVATAESWRGALQSAQRGNTRFDYIFLSSTNETSTNHLSTKETSARVKELRADSNWEIAFQNAGATVFKRAD